jgi:geranylgeranyl pyrophosphate synthase
MDKQFTEDQSYLRDVLIHIFQEQELLATTTLGTHVRQALQAPGKLLASPKLQTPAPELSIPTGVWTLLPLHIGYYCRPTISAAMIEHVALSCECLICALDILDDVEDNDQTPLRTAIGDAHCLNVATTLQTLAVSILASLQAYGLPSQHILQQITIMQRQLLLATQGQHEDLQAETRSLEDVSAEEYLHIAENKAGALISMVCQLAVVAADTLDLLPSFAQLGTALGIAHQIDNDTRDLSVLLASPFPETAIKSDLKRSKKTLPIILAHQQYTTLLQNIPLAADEQERGIQKQDIQQRAYKEAITAAVGVSLYYRLQVRELVQQIEAQHGTPFPVALKFLLSIDTL